MSKADLSDYSAYTLTFACGHSEVHHCYPRGHDRTTAAFCPKCDARRDRAIAKVCREMTGQVPDESFNLRWRLGATPAELTAALEAKGLPVPTLYRDAADDFDREVRYHRTILMTLKGRTGRCACGCGATWNHTVSGSVGGQAAVWGVCPIHRGSAVTGPIVGGEMIGRLSAARDSAARLGVEMDEMIEAAE